jgi:hypothetical protein
MCEIIGGVLVLFGVIGFTYIALMRAMIGGGRE